MGTGYRVQFGNTGSRNFGHDAKDVGRGAAAHGREETELVVGRQTMVGGDVIVADRERREWTELRELGVAVGDRRPRRLDRATFRKIDFELFASERLSVPGEETNPDAHLGRELRSGATDRSRSSTSRSDS